MTPELAEAIVTWRSSRSNNATSGNAVDVYQRLNPPYRCKYAPFESVDELRLVYGATLDVLYGEDVNLNGVLDLNENDGELTPPSDNLDGRLDPGILEYVTVYTHEPATTTNGTARVNVVNLGSGAEMAALSNLLATTGVTIQRQVLDTLRARPPGSVLEFYRRSRLTPDDFALIEGGLRNGILDGLVNVNTASASVLACVPGIGVDNASAIVAYRQNRSASQLTSQAWLTEVLEANAGNQAGPYLTGKTFQCTADIAALGHFDRGYRREKYVFDTSESMSKILYRQDLTHMGWSMGKQTRDVLLAKGTR